MKAVTIVGILLIIVGIAGFVLGGISFTHEKKDFDLGPLQVAHKETNTFPISPVLSALSPAVPAPNSCLSGRPDCGECSVSPVALSGGSLHPAGAGSQPATDAFPPPAFPPGSAGARRTPVPAHRRCCSDPDPAKEGLAPGRFLRCCSRLASTITVIEFQANVQRNLSHTHLLPHAGGSGPFPIGCNFENGLVTRFLSA